MKVTEVRISPANRSGRVRAFASIVIDDCFIVNDLRIVEGREGQLYVTMPARKARNGQLRDIAHPLNGQTREAVEQQVLAEFKQAVGNLSVPQAAGEGVGEGGGGSLIDRLAAKLFAEEFWIADGGAEEEDGK
jgi:stage V sporulation protein G